MPFFYIHISQGSVATCLRSGGYLNMSLLQIYYWVRQWKKFEIRLIFGEVMSKSLVSCFCWLTVYKGPVVLWRFAVDWCLTAVSTVGRRPLSCQCWDPRDRCAQLCRPAWWRSPPPRTGSVRCSSTTCRPSDKRPSSPSMNASGSSDIDAGTAV